MSMFAALGVLKTKLTISSIVNNFLFAHETNVLEDEAAASTLRANSYELLQGCHLNKHLPWIPDFLESLPLAISKPGMPPGLVDLLDLFDVGHSLCSVKCCC